MLYVLVEIDGDFSVMSEGTFCKLLQQNDYNLGDEPKVNAIHYSNDPDELWNYYYEM